jgi:hypothetical protein
MMQITFLVQPQTVKMRSEDGTPEEEVPELPGGSWAGGHDAETCGRGNSVAAGFAMMEAL